MPKDKFVGDEEEAEAIIRWVEKQTNGQTSKDSEKKDDDEEDFGVR